MQTMCLPYKLLTDFPQGVCYVLEHQAYPVNMYFILNKAFSQLFFFFYITTLNNPTAQFYNGVITMLYFPPVRKGIVSLLLIIMAHRSVQY